MSFCDCFTASVAFPSSKGHFQKLELPSPSTGNSPIIRWKRRLKDDLFFFSTNSAKTLFDSSSFIYFFPSFNFSLVFMSFLPIDFLTIPTFTQAYFLLGS
jgi:hypothetical protein